MLLESEKFLVKGEGSASDLGAEQNNDGRGPVAAPERAAARCALLFRSAFLGFVNPFYQQLGVPYVSIFPHFSTTPSSATGTASPLFSPLFNLTLILFIFRTAEDLTNKLHDAFT